MKEDIVWHKNLLFQRGLGMDTAEEIPGYPAATAGGTWYCRLKKITLILKLRPRETQSAGVRAGGRWVGSPVVVDGVEDESHLSYI